ncbi:hypothetical protein ACFV3R_25160 [Streptomyces sp. NPDC059740]|uniref:hypothetical protein n=1 Tax=Streptomyces sp. NPDC059740 TaxID=3346926 RepID=UPI00366158A6
MDQESVEEMRQQFVEDRQKRARAIIPTPWPQLTELAAITYRYKAGFVAERGSREAKIGRDIAVHAAEAGIPTVLFTGYPPARVPETLLIDTKPNPTPDDINARGRTLIRGRMPELLVVERFERIGTSHPEQPVLEADSEEEREDLSWGDRLMWAVRDVHLDYPSIYTTVANKVDPTRPLLKSVESTDHPGMVMTDVCRPVLMVRRSGPTTVDVRFEVDALEYRVGPYTVEWEPLQIR